MALSDTIGHPLEIFASKSSTDAKSTAFKTAHPGALCFTTDGKIVFGGKEVGGTPTAEINGADIKVFTPSLSRRLNMYNPLESQRLGEICDTLGTFLGSIPAENVWIDHGLSYPGETLSSVLTRFNLSDARVLEFSDRPELYMPNASGLLGNNIYQGMWLGSIIDDMCREIQTIKNKVK